MKQTGQAQIAARYVKAAFDVAREKSAISAVEQDLQALSQAVQGDKECAAMLASPLLNASQQQLLVAAVADRLSAHPVTKALLLALVGKRRLLLLPEVSVQFSVLAQKSRGEMVAEVVTASPISKEEEAYVAEVLAKAYGKKILLRSAQSKTLLGGVVIKVGGLQLDASLAGKLSRIEQKLKAA